MAIASVRPLARIGASITALLLAVSLAGCGGGTTEPETPADVTTTVTDPEGNELQMPAEPQSALGFYTTDVDVLITLGFTLAEQQPIRGNYDSFPSYFPAEALSGVTPFPNYPEYDYEKVLSAEPDFILNGLGYDKETHPRLAEVAPTYTVNAFDDKNWVEHFAQTAKDLGREDQYQAWREAHATQAETVQQEIADAGHQDLTVATFGYFEGAAQVACGAGVECNVFEEVGLNVTPLAADAAASIPTEQLGKLKDVDAVWMGVAPGADSEQKREESLAELSKLAIWQELPFVKNKRIYTYDMEMQYGSPSGQDAFLEQVRKDLTSNPATEG